MVSLRGFIKNSCSRASALDADFITQPDLSQFVNCYRDNSLVRKARPVTRDYQTYEPDES